MCKNLNLEKFEIIEHKFFFEDIRCKNRKKPVIHPYTNIKYC
jgi:hypothetical protein